MERLLLATIVVVFLVSGVISCIPTVTPATSPVPTSTPTSSPATTVATSTVTAEQAVSMVLTYGVPAMQHEAAAIGDWNAYYEADGRIKVQGQVRLQYPSGSYDYSTLWIYDGHTVKLVESTLIASPTPQAPAPIYEIPEPVPTLPTQQQPAPNIASDMERVLVYKVLDWDTVIVSRSNGEKWILEKGIGCLSLDYYEGRYVYIYSPGLFASIGSKIIIPERDQQCRIWDSEFLGINPTIIESHINGTFEGWDGDTIFELMNGQIWKQASYSYTYHYAYCPEVFIFSTAYGYRMMVDGVSETIYVIQLK